MNIQKYVLPLAMLVAAPAVADETSPEIAPPGCEYGSPHPEAAAELAQFDFLIGDFTIEARTWTGEDWSDPVAAPPPRWNGRYALGGMAIEDEWFDTDPGISPGTTRGINIRMWDPRAEEWDMMWLHSQQNQVYDLRAKMIDGKLTMWNAAPLAPAYDAEFERIDADTWTRTGFRKAEDGTVTPTFKLIAKRIPCPQAG